MIPAGNKFIPLGENVLLQKVDDVVRSSIIQLPTAFGKEMFAIGVVKRISSQLAEENNLWIGDRVQYLTAGEVAVNEAGEERMLVQVQSIYVKINI